MDALDSPPVDPRASRLGSVALLLAIVGCVASVASAAMLPIVVEVLLFNPSTGRWVFASDTAEALAMPTVALGAIGLASGITGIVLGVLAIIRRARRAQGIVAIVASVLAPTIAFLTFGAVALAMEWA